MPVTLVKTKWSSGNLYFLDKNGNAIAIFDGTNNLLDIKSMKLNGTAVASTAAELNKLQGAGAAVASGTKVAHIADPSGGATVDAEARTAVNAILDALEAFGIAASV